MWPVHVLNVWAKIGTPAFGNQSEYFLSKDVYFVYF